jgi:hypothetical protein
MTRETVGDMDEAHQMQPLHRRFWVIGIVVRIESVDLVVEEYVVSLRNG